MQVRTLPTVQVPSASTDSFSRGHDPFTHACKARELSLSLSLSNTLRVVWREGTSTTTFSDASVVSMFQQPDIGRGIGGCEGRFLFSSLPHATLALAIFCALCRASMVGRNFRPLENRQSVWSCCRSLPMGFFGALFVSQIDNTFERQREAIAPSWK